MKDRFGDNFIRKLKSRGSEARQTKWECYEKGHKKKISFIFIYFSSDATCSSSSSGARQFFVDFYFYHDCYLNKHFSSVFSLSLALWSLLSSFKWQSLRSSKFAWSVELFASARWVNRNSFFAFVMAVCGFFMSFSLEIVKWQNSNQTDINGVWWETRISTTWQWKSWTYFIPIQIIPMSKSPPAYHFDLTVFLIQNCTTTHHLTMITKSILLAKMDSFRERTEITLCCAVRFFFFARSALWQSNKKRSPNELVECAEVST